MKEVRKRNRSYINPTSVLCWTGKSRYQLYYAAARSQDLQHKTWQWLKQFILSPKAFNLKKVHCIDLTPGAAQTKKQIRCQHISISWMAKFSDSKDRISESPLVWKQNRRGQHALQVSNLEIQEHSHLTMEFAAKPIVYHLDQIVERLVKELRQWLPVESYLAFVRATRTARQVGG